VNFLLSQSGFGEGWGGEKIYDSCKDCYNAFNVKIEENFINLILLNSLFYVKITLNYCIFFKNTEHLFHPPPLLIGSDSLG